MCPCGGLKSQYSKAQYLALTLRGPGGGLKNQGFAALGLMGSIYCPYRPQISYKIGQMPTITREG